MKFKFKLIFPILYLLMLFGGIILFFYEICMDVNSTLISSWFVFYIICFIMIFIWLMNLVVIFKSKKDEGFLSKALAIFKIGMIPYAIIATPIVMYMTVVIVCALMQYTFIILLLLAVIILLYLLPSSMCAIFLNNIRCSQSIMPKRTKNILNILQFIVGLHTISSIITLTKYKNKNFK